MHDVRAHPEVYTILVRKRGGLVYDDTVLEVMLRTLRMLLSHLTDDHFILL
jgi:hypothetical protein